MWEASENWSLKLAQSINLEHLSKSKSFRSRFNKSFFHYKGSISTPPCTEGVEHFVLKEAAEIPKSYLAVLRKKVSKTSNNRDVQSFNDVVFSWED